MFFLALSKRAALIGLTLLINGGKVLIVAFTFTVWFYFGVSFKIPDFAFVTGLFSFLGNKTKLFTYCNNLCLLASKDSWDLFLRLWSTEIPMDLANWTLSPAALISWRVKPLPFLTLWLYLMVVHLTTGLSKSKGLGAMAAALALLACNLLLFLAAWFNQTLTLVCQCFLRWTLGITLLCLTIGYKYYIKIWIKHHLSHIKIFCLSELSRIKINIKSLKHKVFPKPTWLIIGWEIYLHAFSSGNYVDSYPNKKVSQ